MSFSCFDRERWILRAHQDKLRKARILQVRALEKRFASQRVQRFVEKQEQKKQALIRQLQQDWEADHRARVEELEQKCLVALSNLSDGHEAASLVTKNKEATAKIFEMHAQDRQVLERKRYRQALRREHKKVEQVVEPRRRAQKRKRTKELAACFERSIARFSSHTSSRGPSPLSSSDATEPPAKPLKLSTYKYTFFHSRLPGSKQAWSSTDAREAAEAQKRALEQQKLKQKEIDEVLGRRVALRGQAAVSRIMVRKRIQALERELDIAVRRDAEERQQRLLRPLKEEDTLADFKQENEADGTDEQPKESGGRSVPESRKVVMPEAIEAAQDQQTIEGLENIVNLNGIPATLTSEPSVRPKQASIEKASRRKAGETRRLVAATVRRRLT